MSETVRSYTGSTHNAGPRGGTTRRRRFSVRGKVVFCVVLAFPIVYGAWSTRDNYPVETLIPANQAYQVVAADVFGVRNELAESKILKALPAEAGLGTFAESLAGDLGVPEWILNNLVPNLCVLSGKDMLLFHDPLIVTRMTRVGCLLTKLRRFAPGIESDSAGGLSLSRVESAGIYFATRGRALVISSSRDALIRSLTLRPKERLTREGLADMLKDIGTEDLVGTLRFGSGVPGDVRFSARVESSSLRAKCTATPGDDWDARLGGFIQGVQPAELIVPPDGMLQISLNFGKSVRELWSAGSELAGMGEEAESLWQKLTGVPDGAGPNPVSIAMGFVGQLGPGVRLSLRGVDLNEMLPVPQVVATFDANPDAAVTAFSMLPPLAADASRYRMQPQYDASAKCVRLPLIGGPSMEPTAGILGDSLLVSSSRTVAESLLGGDANVQRFPQPANVYVSVQPQALLEAVTSLASLLADNAMVRGYTSEGLRQFVAPWSACAAEIKDITASARLDGGTLNLELAISGKVQ